MTDKVEFSAKAASLAALFSTAALTKILSEKGLLNADDLNEVYATAASMCHGNGAPEAAALIETMVPSIKGIDPVDLARKRGNNIKTSD